MSSLTIYFPREANLAFLILGAVLSIICTAVSYWSWTKSQSYRIHDKQLRDQQVSKTKQEFVLDDDHNHTLQHRNIVLVHVPVLLYLAGIWLVVLGCVFPQDGDFSGLRPNPPMLIAGLIMVVGTYIINGCHVLKDVFAYPVGPPLYHESIGRYHNRHYWQVSTVFLIASIGLMVFGYKSYTNTLYEGPMKVVQFESYISYNNFQDMFSPDGQNCDAVPQLVGGPLLEWSNGCQDVYRYIRCDSSFCGSYKFNNNDYMEYYFCSEEDGCSEDYVEGTEVDLYSDDDDGSENEEEENDGNEKNDDDNGIRTYYGMQSGKQKLLKCFQQYFLEGSSTEVNFIGDTKTCTLIQSRHPFFYDPPQILVGYMAGLVAFLFGLFGLGLVDMMRRFRAKHWGAIHEGKDAILCES